MRSHSPCPVFALLLAFCCASCSGDPETLKREYLAEGDRHTAEGKPAEAIVAFRNALRQDGQSGEIRLRLATAYEAAGDYGNALREAVRAADLLPDSTDAQLRAGRLLLVSGQYEDAKTRASSVLARETRNVEALLLLGNALANLQDLDGAIAQVEQAIELRPDQPLNYENLGVLQIAKGDREAAEGALRRAVEVQPNSAEPHVALGNYFWATGRMAEAEAELKAAFGLSPASAAVNRGLGAFYMATGKLQDAEPFLKRFADGSSQARSKLVLADYYMVGNRTGDATKVLEPLVKQTDGFEAATARLAIIDFRAGRQSDAYRRLQDMLDKDAKSRLGLETKTRFLLAERKYGEALQVVTALVDADPKGTSGPYLRGITLQRMGSIGQATSAFESVLQTAPTFVPAKIALAELHLRRGDQKRAVALSTEVVAARPQSFDAHFLLGRTLLTSGDLPNAERELLAVAKAAPNSAVVHAWLGRLYEAKRDRGAARGSFTKALQLDPDNRMALAGLINADLAERKLDAARAKIETNIATSPKDTELLVLAGMTYSAMGDLSRAESAYRALLEADPNNLQAYANLGGLYAAQRRLDEARRMFEDVAKVRKNPTAMTMIGMILTMQNKHQEGRKYYLEALALNPRAAVAANNLAWDYAENGGNLSIALQLAQTAKAQLPDSAQVNDTLGWVYYKNNLFSQAVDSLRDAAEQRPSNPRVQYRLGLAYIKNGNAVEARQTLQRVLKLDPQFAQSQKVAELIATIKG